MAVRRLGRASDEKGVELACDELILKLGAAIVARLSQARASHQTPGISDRRYAIYNRPFWYEVKTERGKFYPEQYDFLAGEISRGEICGAGGVRELYTLIRALRRSPDIARRVGEQSILEIRARGFLRHSKRQTTKRLGPDLRATYENLIRSDPARFPAAARHAGFVSLGDGAVTVRGDRLFDDPPPSDAGGESV